MIQHVDRGGATSANLRRNPAVPARILPGDFDGPDLQRDGQAEVLDML